jgi:hypothetical protein
VKKNTKTKPVLVKEPAAADFELTPEQHRRATALLAARATIADTTGSGMFAPVAGHVEGRHLGELIDLAEYIIDGVPPAEFTLADDSPRCAAAAAEHTTVNLTVNPNTEGFRTSAEPLRGRGTGDSVRNV